MVPVDRSRIRLDAKISADEHENFNELMLEAFDKPWWRAIIKAVEARRNDALQQLANGQEDQRTEDKLRGRIFELNFFITIDDLAATKIAEERNKNGSRV